MESREPDPHDAAPSRTRQRRDALAVLALAERLTTQSPAWLDRAGLPDDVRAEIDNVRRITAHGARKRQLAYLAKLMRRHDEAFAQARELLDEDRTRQARENAALHRLEALRDALVDEGDAALSALVEQRPGADRQRLRALIRQARLQRDKGRPPSAARELFRLLRELHAAD